MQARRGGQAERDRPRLRACAVGGHGCDGRDDQQVAPAGSQGKVRGPLPGAPDPTSCKVRLSRAQRPSGVTPGTRFLVPARPQVTASQMPGQTFVLQQFLFPFVMLINLHLIILLAGRSHAVSQPGTYFIIRGSVLSTAVKKLNNGSDLPQARGKLTNQMARHVRGANGALTAATLPCTQNYLHWQPGLEVYTDKVLHRTEVAMNTDDVGTRLSLACPPLNGPVSSYVTTR